MFAHEAGVVLAAGVHVNLPSGRTLLALLPLFVLLLGLVVYCLIDLARAASVRYLPKAAWALIIVLVSAPIGPLAYLVLGRDRDDNRAETRIAGGSAPRDDRASV